MKRRPEDYWTARAQSWIDESYGDPDSSNAVRLQLAAELLRQHKHEGRVLDIGCGAGYAVRAFLENGWDATGLDFSEGMISAARQHLELVGEDPARITSGSATELTGIADSSCDAVTCLGVLQYVEDDVRAYREASRVLKKGGIYILTHQNELFDLFTFNRYTLAFFERHFVGPLTSDMPEATAIRTALRALISNPDAPMRHDAGSARDAVFTRADNPLTLPDKLGAAGFTMLGPTLALNLHAVPPLIEQQFPSLARRAAHYELARDWRGMFAGAQFMAVCQKIAEPR